jgi:hypothetical protein
MMQFPQRNHVMMNAYRGSSSAAAPLQPVQKHPAKQRMPVEWGGGHVNEFYELKLRGNKREKMIGILLKLLRQLYICVVNFAGILLWIQ